MTPTRRHLLSLLGDVPLLDGYYIDSDDGQPNPLHVYCIAHARKVAERWGRRRGIETYYCEAWAGSDREERCAIVTCDVALDTGGLTSHGVNDALALTEEDPFSSPISKSGLVLAADAMLPDDRRWAAWDRHILAEVRAARADRVR